MRKGLITICLLCALLTACSSVPTGFEVTPDQVALHRLSGTEFPPTIATLSRVGLANYDSEGTDVSANYQTVTPMPILVSMYVFPASNSRGPIALSRTHGDHLRGVVEAHAGALLESDTAAQVVKNGEQIAGKQATFTYSDDFAGGVRKLYSVLADFTYKGWFVLYRMSLPVEARGNALPLLEEFIQEAPWPTVEYTVPAE